MKKLIVCIIILAALLTGCGKAAEAPAEDVQPTVSVTAQPTPEPTPTPTPEPEHSPLYIEGLAVEDVVEYFVEVCLDAEFVNSGDPSKLQKWMVPITYIIEGEYTEEDIAALTGFEQWLNSVEGFPGILGTEEPYQANLKIYFCTGEEMPEIMGENFAGLDGGVTFWYGGDNRIYRAQVAYRTDIDQTVRNSVILEEIYNGLGPVQDTELRTDSIVYSGYSTPQSLTAVDELILKLLYHPDMRCGMNAAQCEEVIRALYY